MPNTNNLENIKCPACGNEDQFRIRATTLATVTDDGVEDHGDMEWDDDSYADCSECLKSGKLRDFQLNPDHREPSASIEATDQALLKAAQLVVSRWEKGDLAEAVRFLSDAVEKAQAT